MQGTGPPDPGDLRPAPDSPSVAGSVPCALGPDPDSVAEVARLLRGLSPADRAGLGSWGDSGDQLDHDLRHTAGAVRLDVPPFPEVGAGFAGFYLQAELGR